jgi:hypothetical protein
MSTLIYKPNIRWGYLGTSVFLFILLLNLFFIALMFITPLILIFFGIPIILLDILLLPLIKSILKVTDFELHTDGLTIKKKKIFWKEVKSISFQTGRPIYDRNFNSGFKLPALQKIYVLDKKGLEYSAVIDADFYLKKNRNKNNIRIISKFLLGMDKQDLIADWAEKR